jgi:hypothetical protein
VHAALPATFWRESAKSQGVGDSELNPGSEAQS